MRCTDKFLNTEQKSLYFFYKLSKFTLNWKYNKNYNFMIIIVMYFMLKPIFKKVQEHAIFKINYYVIWKIFLKCSSHIYIIFSESFSYNNYFNYYVFFPICQIWYIILFFFYLSNFISNKFLLPDLLSLY